MAAAHDRDAPGTEPVEVEFRLGSTQGAFVDVVPPADGVCQVRVERFVAQGAGGDWQLAGSVAAIAPRRLDDLVPARYRLRDTRSEVTGPEVEVVAGGAPVQLSLDLGRVVAARGLVVAQPPFGDTRIELRSASGAVLRQQDVNADGSFDLRASIDEPGLVLVALRGNACSAAQPFAGELLGIQLVLPE